MPLKLNQDELPTINLTSLIDILFLLIIFFMVGTKFTETDSNISVNLPKVAPNGAMVSKPASKKILVTADGSVHYEGQRVNAEQLSSILAQEVRNYPDTTVQVKGDSKATLEMLAVPLSLVQRAGAKLEMNFASTQMPNARR